MVRFKGKLIYKDGYYLDQLRSDKDRWVYNKVFTKYLKDHYKLGTEDYYKLVKGLDSTPKCPVCNNDLVFDKLYCGYGHYCSTKCQMQDQKHAKGSVRVDLSERNKTNPPKLSHETRVLNGKKANKTMSNRIKGYLVSQEEYSIYQYIRSLGIKVVPQYKLADKSLKNGYHRYDMAIYIHDTKVLIEYDGSWHVSHHSANEMLRIEVANKLGLKLVIITHEEYHNSKLKDLIRLKLPELIQFID